MDSHMIVARDRASRVAQQAYCAKVKTCAVETSYYYYYVNLPVNAVFLALFSLSLLGFIVTYGLTRRGFAFTVAMLSGVLLEVIGYIGRIKSYQNQWLEDGFLMQIVCLTIAPAFLAGGIYLCLRRIVYAFGPENSRIRPESYTRIFIPCDLISLLLQAAGGGIASAKSHADEDPTVGNNIMIAGLAFQVLTLTVFMALCIDFAIRTRSRYRQLGQAAFDQSPVFIKLRQGWRFKGFLFALTLATICVFWRSVYRVAELSEGWTGSLIRKQWLFVGFEGVMVIVACFSLNLFHPAYTFVDGMEGAGGIGAGRKARKQKKMTAKGAQNSGSGTASDVDGVVKQEAV
ncbi:putative sphingoid long-chain base transporter RSB1 [Calycina marina]|uniref:Sphingoid long-chain base transporter RSB1 n=1 Tax=Calycina marina TaxID=1763456 RepID=A0A9P7Z116_9HELO|nr:putative sphingoid long-chain base transporter RSB1 [Calycina marina]